MNDGPDSALFAAGDRLDLFGKGRLYASSHLFLTVITSDRSSAQLPFSLRRVNVYDIADRSRVSWNQSARSMRTLDLLRTRIPIQSGRTANS